MSITAIEWRLESQCAATCGVRDVRKATGIGGVFTPETIALGPCAHGVFPLSLSDQAIVMPGAHTEPLGVGLGIVPTDTNDGVVFGLREARAVPARLRVDAEFFGIEGCAAKAPCTTRLTYEASVLRPRDLMLADGEGAWDRMGD